MDTGIKPCPWCLLTEATSSRPAQVASPVRPDPIDLSRLPLPMQDVLLARIKVGAVHLDFISDEEDRRGVPGRGRGDSRGEERRGDPERDDQEIRRAQEPWLGALGEVNKSAESPPSARVPSL